MPNTVVSRRSLGLLAAGAAAAAAAPALGQPAGKGGMAAGLTAGDWMAQVRAQHREIDRHFQLVKTAKTDADRTSHFRMLASLLSGHSLAEEVALYPGLFIQGEESDSKEAYDEQSMAKVLTARIDNAMAMGRRDEAMKLVGQLETAVKAHVAHEEKEWYPALMKKATAQMNAKMTADFRREFTKYMT
jgi:hemerythrin superfamily protein